MSATWTIWSGTWKSGSETCRRMSGCSASLKEGRRRHAGLNGANGRLPDLILWGSLLPEDVLAGLGDSRAGTTET